MRKSIYVKGILLALLAGILWGITGPLGQFLFDEKTITPEWLVTCRLIVSGTVILLGMFVKRRWEIFTIWKDKKDAVHMVIYSVAGMMAVQYSFFVAVEASNGGNATVLQYTNPVMIILYLALFQKVRPKSKEVVAVLLALAGIFLLSTNGNLHTLVITPKGLFMGLLCAVFTCFYSMLPRRLMEKYDEVMVCGWSMFIGGIVLAIWKNPWKIGAGADYQVWGLFGMLVLFGTVIPFIASLKAIMLSGPMYANVLASIEPVVASFLTFLFLGTTFGGFEILGFGCIILTIVMLSLNKKVEA
ncbi:MAG: DMT family transporter [Lachnospiraceae bacterium]|nr:DMT family transporter [Lachnospiraceae bacterium]